MALVTSSSLRWAWVAVMTAAAVAGCGGGGGSTATTPTPPPPPPPPPPVVCTPLIDSTGASVACTDPLFADTGGGDGGDAAGGDGSAGDGAPIAGGQVTLLDNAGKTVRATTDAQGYYRVNLTRLTAPFVLTATSADGKLSYRSFRIQPQKLRGFVTMNITGLTDKLASDIAVANGKSGAKDLTPAMLAANPSAVSTALASLITTIRPQIQAAALEPANFDPLGTFFRPNLTGMDLVLETVAVYYDASGATQIVGKPQTACTAPSSWAAGANVCFPTSNPGFVASGSSARLVDSTGALVGTADFSCSNGVLTATGTPSCAPPTPVNCSAPSATWAVGSSSCSADSAPTPISAGARLTLTDSQGGTAGSITYACTNGELSTVGTPSCTTLPVACSPPASTWSTGGNTCTSDSPTGVLASGGQVTLSDSQAPTTGAVTYACSNGALSVVGSATCVNSAAACAAPTALWSVGGNSCQSDVTPIGLNSGATATLNDTTGATSGSITYACSNGTLAIQGTPSCFGTALCAAPSANWTVGSLACTSDVAPKPFNSGTTQTLADNVGTTNGIIAYTCTNGTVAVQGTPTCYTPVVCAAPPSLWTAAGNTCTSDRPTTPIDDGGSLTLTDSSAPLVGSTTYSCVRGVLAQNSGATCQPATTEKSCDFPANFGWSPASTTFFCTADVTSAVTILSGSSYTYFDTVGPTTGSSTWSCKDGSPTNVSTVCSFGSASGAAFTVRRPASGRPGVSAPGRP